MAEYENNCFILHGAVVWSEGLNDLRQLDDGYVICDEGLCAGVYEEIPEAYRDFPVEDHWDGIIIPGLVDLHVHAAQYNNRALGMDMELIEWLDVLTFPEEAKYAQDRDYALMSYDAFAEDLFIGATTRAVVFATADYLTTLKLMDALEDRGLVTYVGKVNMDRNVPDYYVETTKKSLRHTERWLSRVDGRYENTMPILTPRFTPTCTRELMDGLGELAKTHGLSVQSHLNENPREVEWVRELEPDSASYSDTYLRSGLFGGDVPTIMAHCIYNTEEEIALMRDRGVYVAHCPQSNLNIASGIAPVRRFLDEGIHVGLGTDVSGGHSASIFETMKAAIQSSKMYWRYVDSTKKPLTFPEAFYLGTLGGGEFFGRCGTFREGYEFDAVVLEDSNLYTMRDLAPVERLERIVYLSDDRNVTGKFVRGEKLY